MYVALNCMFKTLLQGCRFVTSQIETLKSESGSLLNELMELKLAQLASQLTHLAIYSCQLEMRIKLAIGVFMLDQLKSH